MDAKQIWGVVVAVCVAVVSGAIGDGWIGDLSELSKLRAFTEDSGRKARDSGRPKVIVEANIHIAQDRFAMNDMNEVIWEEDGKDTPGVWNGKWQVDNARTPPFAGYHRATESRKPRIA